MSLPPLDIVKTAESRAEGIASARAISDTKTIIKRVFDSMHKNENGAVNREQILVALRGDDEVLESLGIESEQAFLSVEADGSSEVTWDTLCGALSIVEASEETGTEPLKEELPSPIKLAEKMALQHVEYHEAEELEGEEVEVVKERFVCENVKSVVMMANVNGRRCFTHLGTLTWGPEGTLTTAAR